MLLGLALDDAESSEGFLLLAGLSLSYPADALASDVSVLLLLAVAGSVHYVCGERTVTGVLNKACMTPPVTSVMQLRMQYSILLEGAPLRLLPLVKQRPCQTHKNR